MSVKLYYFDGRGIAEPIRWILSYAGIEFEDIRLPYDKFPPTLPAEIKAKSRWGQVPLVEFEGKSLTQSMAVARYFAKKAGLVPEDIYQAALCDEYVDAMKDLSGAFFQVFMSAQGDDEETRKEKLIKVRESNKTRFLDVFENIVTTNDGQHLVGNSLTWADIALAYVLDHFKIVHQGVSLISQQEHPGLTKLWGHVITQPGIKEWLQKRPLTKF